MIFKTAIAGVVPRQLAEATIMIVYPSMAEWPWARRLGTWYRIRAGLGNVLTVGNVLALALAPVSLAMFLWRLLPGQFKYYRLTNRRIVVHRAQLRFTWLFGFVPVPARLVFAEDRWISLDRFDNIQIETQPGHDWYSAGDLSFRLGVVETFRLTGVRSPASFRQTCWSAHQSFMLLRKLGVE